MKKALWSLITIVLTAILMLIMSSTNESTAEAEFVRVTRADVHQVIPICGQLVYNDERLITAPATGIATQVCVHNGERIGENAAMIRMEKIFAEGAFEAFAAGQTLLPEMAAMEKTDWLKNGVVRAEKACTVREIYVKEGDLVAMGTPLLRVTSHQQRVLCRVFPRDAQRIEPGMWAWLTSEGEKLCIASVESVGERKADGLTGMEIQEVLLIPEQEIEMAEYAMIDADVYLAGSDDVRSLPLYTITERGTVWWVNEERCTEIPAQIVLHDEMRAWVQLPEGMTVAVGEFEEGQRIKEVHP